VVEVVTGPRVEVVEQREEVLAGGQPLLHSTIAPYADEAVAGEAAQAESDAVLARCSDLLAGQGDAVKGLQEVCGRLTHFPPLFHAERFGLWVCARLLAPADVEQRLVWLYHRDSTKRLAFAQTSLEAALGQGV